MADGGSGHAGRVCDVRDAGVEEAVALEDLPGGADERVAGAGAAGGERFGGEGGGGGLHGTPR